MKRVPKTLAGRVRYARGLTHHTAKGLDRVAGLTEGHTTMIESGRRPRIEAGTAQALADALGVSLDWLIAGRGEGPKSNAAKVAS